MFGSNSKIGKRSDLMDIMEILIAEECGVFDDLDKDKEEREEESK